MTFTLAIHYTIGAVLYPFFVYIFFGMVLSPRKLKGPYWLYAVLGVLCLQPFCTARCLLDESSFFFQLMAWIHDEVQIACRTEEIAKDAIEIAQASMRQTQEFFGFRVQLDTEGKIGRNWKDCH